MGTAKRREGAVPSGPADVDPDAGLDAGPDEDEALDEALDGGIDAATDGAEAATEEDALEERGLRVAWGSVDVARSRAALARDAGCCAVPEGFSAEVGETGVMSSGVGDMAGAPFKHLQTHAPECANAMTRLKVLWEFIRVSR